MEIFSTEQSDFMANNISRDIAVRAACRDGYTVLGSYAGHLLTLCIDHDREECLKKNFYSVIDPSGLSYSYDGCTYRHMSGEELKRFVTEIKDGQHEGRAWA